MADAVRPKPTIRSDSAHDALNGTEIWTNADGNRAVTQYIVLIALALATSLDSMGLGVAFGLSATRIRPLAHAVICAVMLVITAGGVFIGDRLAAFLPDQVARDLSATLFIAVGLWMLIPILWDRRPGCPPRATDATPCRGHIVGLREAFGLGFMLSINNVGGGISAGLIHIGVLPMALLSVFFNVVCLVGGHAAGSLLRRTPIKAIAQGLAGAILVAVGLWEMIGV